MLFVIGFRHINEWGKTNIMEGFFAIAGLVGIDIVKKGRFELKKDYKDFDVWTLPRAIGIFFVIFLVQIIAQSIVPFTIDNIEKGLSIIFAAIAEELFFRGFLISIFKKIGSQIPETKLGVVIVGMVLSSVFFAYIHTNYYNNLNMMVAVFVGGLVLCGAYYKFDDLTANILAHLILNCIVVWQLGLFSLNL